MNSASRIKTAQEQDRTVGTATRLTTGMRPGTRSNVTGGSTLNTSVRVEDRPITQQGLTGLKQVGKASKRQIEDKSYYLGLIRGKINEITQELNTVVQKTAASEEENATFVQYEQMAEKLAYEIKEMQGELGDYNMLVGKATLGNDVANIELDWEEARAINERAEQNLETLFEAKQKQDVALKAVETELKQEQKLSESILEELNDENRQQYARLIELNAHLVTKLNEGQSKLGELTSRKKNLEEDVSNSQVKLECLRLLAQIRESGAHLKQLQTEAASEEDPQEQRERLLQQVRDDNQEIASIERQTRDTQDKVAHREEELRLLEQELDEGRNERSQKHRELKKREQQIDEFLRTFDDVKALEVECLNDTEKTVTDLLELTSQHIINTSETGTAAAAVCNSSSLPNQTKKDEKTPVGQLKEQLAFKTSEITKSEETSAALNKERTRLSQDLLKVDQLETKVTQEMESLRKRISRMEEEILLFSDLEKVKEDAKFKREELIIQKELLETNRESLHRTNQSLAKEYANLQANLSGQDTHTQLVNLERRWIQHEQLNFGLKEFLANKRVETDHGHLAEKASELVKQHNEYLKNSLSSKPIVL